MTLKELEKKVNNQKNQVEGFVIENGILDEYTGPKNATTIKVPDGVTYIGCNAFYKVKAKEIILPSSVTSLSMESFISLPNLESITLPEKLEQLASDPFFECFNLKNIYVDEKNPYFKSIDGVLYNKSGKEILMVPEGKEGEVVIEDGVRVLRSGVFNNCHKVTSIKMPDTVKTIIPYSLNDCTKLRTITIPPLVKKVEPSVFFNCNSLQEILVAEDNPYLTSIDGVLYSKDLTELCVIPNDKSNDTVTLPPTVKSFPNYIFFNSNIKCLVIPEEIDFNTFVARPRERYFTPNVKSIIFKNKKTKIKDDWFVDPRKVNYVDDKAYDYLKTLVVNFYPNQIETHLRPYMIKSVAKAMCERQDIDEDVKKSWLRHFKTNRKKYYYAMLENKCLLSIMLDNAFLDLDDTQNLIELNSNSFKEDFSISTLLLEYQNKHYSMEDVLKQKEKKFEVQDFNSLTYIKKNWSYSVKEDGTIRIVNYKGKDTFLVVPETIEDKVVTEIGEGAFSSSSGKRINDEQKMHRQKIESITLPDTITTIGPKAFWQCYNLKHINIPKGVTSFEAFPYLGIGLMGVFFNCYNISKLVLPDSITEIGEYSLSQAGYFDVELSKNLTEIPRGAFFNCRFFERIEIPEGVRVLRRECFAHCHDLREVIIPSTMQSIKPSAFSQCESLETIIIKSEKVHIDSIAFHNNGKLIIKGIKGSYVENFAHRAQIRFEEL